MKHLAYGMRLAAILLLPVSLGAQSTRTASSAPRSASVREQQLARADSFFMAGNADASWAHVDDALRADSSNFAVLWRAARGETMLGILSEPRSLSDMHLQRAVDFARRAIVQRPDTAEGYVWLAAALGRMALHGDMRHAAMWGTDAYAATTRAIALDSMHASAQDIMGKLHSEARKLPWIVRMLAGDIARVPVVRLASWESAERHLKRALALDGQLLVAHGDLIQLYLRTGRLADAERQLQRMISIAPRSPVDGLFLAEATRRVARARAGHPER
jgi:tetratricopeptide (TPR) repeat protein